MYRVRILLLLCAAGVLSACAASPRNEIEGNNTGGIIPPAAARGRDVQTLANAHCAKYGATARITFGQAEAGGDTVFVCEAGPVAAPSNTKQDPQGSKQAPSSTKRGASTS